MAKTIMVVEAEEDNRNTVKILLEENGYCVITAIDGDDCLRKLPGLTIDLILMGILMPGTPVKDVIRQIRDIKIVYLTVVRISEAEKEELLQQENIADLIQKPFDIDDLLRRIKGIVGSR